MSLKRIGHLALIAGALLMPSAAIADVQYYYDSAGRLTRATYSNGVTIEYRYDNAGNRTQVVTTTTPNFQPVAANDTATVQVSGAVNIQALNNDSDPDGNTLTITNVSTPTAGTAQIMGGGTYIRYTAPSTTGTRSFTYTISDGAGGAATATVSVQVTSVNTPPTAVNDLASATVNSFQAIMVLANDSDAQGHALTVTAVTNPTGGTASIAPGGAYVMYSAPMSPGDYTFSYTVTDSAGASATAQVTVQVTPGEEPCVPTGGNQCDIDP